MIKNFIDDTKTLELFVKAELIQKFYKLFIFKNSVRKRKNLLIHVAAIKPTHITNGFDLKFSTEFSHPS